MGLWVLSFGVKGCRGFRGVVVEGLRGLVFRGLRL
jgi:hypothetical protein